MKKAIVTFVGGIMMVACTNSPVSTEPKIGELVQDTSWTGYKMIVTGEDGLDSTKQIEFRIRTNIVDSLKLADTTIYKMCDNAARYADWDVKNERSFRFSTKSNLVYTNSDGGISVSVSGVAANSYGVEGNITTIVAFDSKGRMILTDDEYQLPVVYTFD